MNNPPTLSHLVQLVGGPLCGTTVEWPVRDGKLTDGALFACEDHSAHGYTLEASGATAIHTMAFHGKESV